MEDLTFRQNTTQRLDRMIHATPMYNISNEEKMRGKSYLPRFCKVEVIRQKFEAGRNRALSQGFGRLQHELPKFKHDDRITERRRPAVVVVGVWDVLHRGKPYSIGAVSGCRFELSSNPKNYRLRPTPQWPPRRYPKSSYLRQSCLIYTTNFL